MSTLIIVSANMAESVLIPASRGTLCHVGYIPVISGCYIQKLSTNIRWLELILNRRTILTVFHL